MKNFQVPAQGDPSYHWLIFWACIIFTMILSVGCASSPKPTIISAVQQNKPSVALTSTPIPSETPAPTVTPEPTQTSTSTPLPPLELPKEGWITFVDMEGIWAVHPDGSGLIKISLDGVPVDYTNSGWTANGDNFYFYNASTNDLYIWDSKNQKTTSPKKILWSTFDLSPDGQKIVFERNTRHQKKGLPTSRTINDGLGIFDIAPKTEQPLPFKPDQDQLRFMEPKWSPDGQTIFFTVASDSCQGQDSCSFGFYDLETQSASYTSPLKGYHSQPVWSADGTKIAVKMADPMLDPAKSNIAIFDKRGAVLYEINRPDVPFKDWYINWIRNGEAIAIQATDNNNQYRVDIFDLQTKTRQEWMEGQYFILSADGEWGIFNRSGDSAETLVNLTTGQSFPLPIPSGSFVYWQP